jgi:hypothetical protein
MSARTRRPRNPATEKPGCAHCRNLGEPFDHWLRASIDPNSPITCPVLLATECRYCRQMGHTTSRCPSRRPGSGSGSGSGSVIAAPEPVAVDKAPIQDFPVTRCSEIQSATFTGRSWVEINEEEEERLIANGQCLNCSCVTCCCKNEY